jgi:hypothetical protein
MKYEHLSIMLPTYIYLCYASVSMRKVVNYIFSSEHPSTQPGQLPAALGCSRPCLALSFTTLQCIFHPFTRKLYNAAPTRLPSSSVLNTLQPLEPRSTLTVTENP